MNLPQMSGSPVITDGGLETDLIYHHGVDLPDFASFPLVEDEKGAALLRAYFDGYVDIARRAGAAVQLETPTWRASADWGARLGYTPADLDRFNRGSVKLLQEIRDESGITEFVVSGQLGPRGDGYVADLALTAEEAADYHAPQINSFAAAGADLITVLTLSTADEATGIVRAARAAGLPVAISFTVEVDGRLPDGTTLADTIRAVDAQASPDYFMVNCAHPEHIAPALAEDGDWRSRIHGLRVNASNRSHEELDAMTELDEGDPVALAGAQDLLRPLLPNLQLVGGCCGTDARHVAAMWADASERREQRQQ